MAEIALARVDGRLIHGVVVASWTPNCGADTLIAVDDVTASDEFLVSIMKSSVKSVDCAILSAQQFADYWNQGEFDDRKIFVVFKSVDMAYKTIKAGVKIDSLQLGYTIPSPDKTIVINEKTVKVSPGDVEKLRTLNKDHNVNVFVQYSPQFTAVPYTKWDV